MHQPVRTIRRQIIGALVASAVLPVRADPSDHVTAPAPQSLRAAPAIAVPADVSDLRFAELFRRPVGPRGLEPSTRLLALHGRQVRMVGYMAAASLPMPGRIILAPMPVELGDEDEHLADDLPPQAVFVHLSGTAASRIVPNYSGLLMITGRLEVGAREEPDGHVSTVRLLLDPVASAACLPDSNASANLP